MRSLGERVGGGTASFLEFFCRNKKILMTKYAVQQRGLGKRDVVCHSLTAEEY